MTSDGQFTLKPPLQLQVTVQQSWELKTHKAVGRRDITQELQAAESLRPYSIPVCICISLYTCNLKLCFKGLKLGS